MKKKAIQPTVCRTKVASRPNTARYAQRRDAELKSASQEKGRANSFASERDISQAQSRLLNAWTEDDEFGPNNSNDHHLLDAFHATDTHDSGPGMATAPSKDKVVYQRVSHSSCWTPSGWCFLTLVHLSTSALHIVQAIAELLHLSQSGVD